jgi:hypothetical protein
MVPGSDLGSRVMCFLLFHWRRSQFGRIVPSYDENGSHPYQEQHLSRTLEFDSEIQDGILHTVVVYRLSGHTFGLS